MQRIPISLVTGFLGSGKTSLINKLLSLPEAAGTAVVVNEFGEIGVDHDLILASNDNVILLANGCFCCAMRGDLVTALDTLYRGGRLDTAASFKRVVIETSGLADASLVIQLLRSELSITARYRLDGVVTIVDSINGEVTLDNHLESVKQVAVADQIVLSKTDLLESAEGSEVKILMDRIKTINPAAPVCDAREQEGASLFAAFFCDAEHSIWMCANAYSETEVAPFDRPSSHDHRFNAFCYVRDEAFSEDALYLLLSAMGDNLGPRLLRIKGIVNVREYPDSPAVIHGAQKLLHDLEWLKQWPSADRNSRIVFITMDTDRPLIEELVELADRLAANAARARSRSDQLQKAG